ncbi:MmcB family DNA repair protein [Methyloligella sp. 2.7D]|uniref:MmcB family DNA repair protein n=1 Tax=unclassified Methyloligella TaxID=2625955 RepID=UPI00157E0E39|nr:MmcB family DNA repair protein [Methyloligella sp. GL2]QKP76033.1 MmcB family DNA repair protein [Methyloligella sp. GL2]
MTASNAPLNASIDETDDPVSCPDGRQSPAAAALQRGVSRALRALGHSVVTELVLAGGRRADVVGLSPSGDIWIVEIKSCLADFQADNKWFEYLDHCDRLYFAVATDFPIEVLPGEAGLILADRFGAEIQREPSEDRLTAARRKAMTLSFARAAALRLQRSIDPYCGS